MISFTKKQRSENNLVPIYKAMVLAMAITFLTLGLRYLSLLQFIELKAFDILMQLRPVEPVDDRFTLVNITEADLQYLEYNSIPDKIISYVFKKIEQHQPRSIVLHMYRDIPIPLTSEKNLSHTLKHLEHNKPKWRDKIDIYRNYSREQERAELHMHLGLNDRLFAICVGGEPNTGLIPTPPPPEVPPERVGFSDIVLDSDGVLRRHLWYATFKIPVCKSEMSLSLLLATHYLQAEGIEPEITPEFDLRLGKATLRRLQQPAGGYQKIDDRGYQMLLNYRNTGKEQIARSITLKDFLEKPLSPDWLEDRIVFISVSAYQDIVYTPYSDSEEPDQKMSGSVFAQLQMTSQIISAALGERPLLGVWPYWGDALWILGWSLVGGLLAWRVRSLLVIASIGVVATGVLSGVCLILLIQGSWVPMFPPALTMALTGTGIVIYNRRSARYDDKA